jgi:hypothetical protein
MTSELLIDRAFSTVGAFGQRFIVPGPTNDTLTVGDLVTGDVVELAHNVPERRGHPFEPCRFLALSDHELVACSVFDLAHLQVCNDGISVVRRWRNRSETVTSGGLVIASDQARRHLLVGASDKLLRLGEARLADITEVQGERLWGLAIDPDGTRVINGRGDGRLELRRADTLDVHTTYQPFRTPILACTFVGDRDTVVLSSDAWQLIRLNLRTGEVTELPTGGKVIGLHAMPDGRLCVVDLSRVVRVLEGTEVVFEAQLTELGDRYIQASALLPDGSGVLLACESKGLRRVTW